MLLLNTRMLSTYVHSCVGNKHSLCAVVLVDGFLDALLYDVFNKQVLTINRICVY